jgi:hypothetical protein
MVARKRSTTSSQAEATQGQKAVKAATPLGNDLAFTLPTSKGKALDLSYWDLWFALVAVRDFGGDLDRLAKRIKNETGFFYDRDSIERKRWHLRDLKRRLEEASATPPQIVNTAGDLAKTEMRRALTKVKASCDREQEWSVPMRNTPRKWRFEHALRGYWPRFPVSPEPYAKKIGSHFKTKGFYSEDMSFGISRTLDRYTEEGAKLLEAGKAAEALALLRGWMTVVLELMAKADDSCGSIGMSFDEGFAAYLKIPLDKSGIDETVFSPDLLDFLIWEDYGLTDDQIEGYFKGLNEGQADLCIKHLRHEVAALLEDDLEDQSEEALTLLGQVIAEQERFDEFEDVARQMGSRAWRRIVRLVDRAMKRRKKPLALKVFEAAMTKGDHLDFLKEKYEKLKRGHWSPDPRAK